MKKQTLIKILAVVALVTGLLMIFSQPLSNHFVKRNQTAALKNLTPQKIKHNQKKRGMYDYDRVKAIGLKQTASSQFQKPVGAIGALAIPSVNLALPIVKGVSDNALSTGGGTMRPQQTMGEGNYPLAGHYMTNRGILFSPLEDTAKGQLIYLTNLKKIYVYRIYYKKIVPPTAVWLVDNTHQKIVTLFTCADGGKNRWAVRGKFIKTQPANRQNLKIFHL